MPRVKIRMRSISLNWREAQSKEGKIIPEVVVMRKIVRCGGEMRLDQAAMMAGCGI